MRNCGRRPKLGRGEGAAKGCDPSRPRCAYCNDDAGTCVVAARLDNLGKGASGAAVQNLNIALGLDEATGL